MANRGLGSLTLQLILGMGGFTAPLDKAGRDLDKKTRAMEKRAYEFGKQIGTALKIGVGLGVTALGAFGVAMKSAIDQADQLNEISQKIGIPTDVLSGLNYAAKLAGVATEELQAGLVKMIKFQQDAATGGKESTQIFKSLGIAIKDSSGNLRSSADVFSDFANVFASFQDSPEKTALALKVFGKAGAELIPLLDGGAQGIKDYSDELQKLGGVVSPEVALAADALNDNIDKLKNAYGGLALQVAEKLLPTLIQLTDQFVNSAKAGEGVSGTADSIAEGFAFIAKSAASLVNGLLGVADAYQIVGAKSSAILGNTPIGKLFGADVEKFNEISKIALEDLKKQRQATRDLWGLDGPVGTFDAPGATVGRRSGSNTNVNRVRATSGGPDLSFLRNPSADAAKKGLSDAEKDAKALEEAYKRMNAQMAESISLFGQTTEVAKVRYELENGELSKLSQGQKDQLIQKAQTLDQLSEEKRLLDERNKADQERMDLQENARESVAGLLSDMQFELDLMGKTNAERVAANELRRIGIGLTADEASAAKAAIEEKEKQLETQRKLIDSMDEFRSSFEDNFAAVLDGSKSAKDAFKDFADSVVQQLIRIAAQKAAMALFGEQGSSGGGLLGGLVSSLFSAYTGSSSSSNFGVPAQGSGRMAGFATGTNFAPGGLAWVGEQGPELMNLPRGSQIIPHHESLRMASGSRGVSVVQNFNRPVDRRTGTQAAQSTARAVGRATERMS